MYIMIGIVVILCIIIAATAEEPGLTIISLLFIVMLSFFLGVGTTASKETTQKIQEKEQPKYKQEIVYSLKDGKYLPTDTLYIEIK